MSLDSKYIIAPAPEQYYVDKDTGLPLAAGVVKFWKDNNRSSPKPVYKLSGTAPNYNYVDIGSVITLSGVGTFQDGNGNNIIPYYYPYDADENPELYYLEVFSSGGTPQFTREAWPNFISNTSSDQGLDITNYIPNGQFLLHNNIPFDVISKRAAGQINQAITQIAEGGWTFERPNTSNAIDNISFQRYGSYVSDPSGSPRFAVRVNCSGANPSDSFKNLCITFGDVNKFASSTQYFTFTFNAIADNSVDFAVNLYVIKNYGTGGSPTDVISIDTFNITNTDQLLSSSFTFGDNIGKNIGILNDDYIQIAIGFPTNISYTGLFTDFSLVIGDINVVIYPTETNRDAINRSLVPVAPDYDGYNIGLPLIQTKDGLSFDDSQVGKVYSTISYQPAFGELPCDGSVYRSDAYSADGIPYRRLRNKLVNIQTPVFDLNQPMFGTGSTYATASDLNTGLLVISTNSAGTQTATADGSVATGFTFTTVALGQASANTLGLDCYTYGPTGTQFWALQRTAGYVTPGTTSSAGCPQITMSLVPSSEAGEIIGTLVAQQMNSVLLTATPAASTFIQIGTVTGQLKVWFTVNGVGTLPAGTGTPVRINLLSDMGTTDSSYVIAQVLSGYQVSTCRVVAGNLIVPNSYFTFYATGQLYYVWYSLNGVGIDPQVINGIGIPISYTISDNISVIESKTIQGINDLYFATPDLRGWTIKGWSNTSTTDKNKNYRYSANGTRYDHPQIGLPAYIGSYQKDVLLDHTHPRSVYSPVSPENDSILDVVSSGNYNATRLTIFDDIAYQRLYNVGTGQNDTKNVYLNYVIKY